MLVGLAKLTSPESVGHFALALALTAPVVMFANLQLRAVQSTDASCRYAFGHLVRLRLLTTAIALVIIASIVLAGGYRGDTARVILAVGVLKAVEAISDVFYGRMQQREEMDRIARSLMLRGTGALALLLGSLHVGGSLVLGITAMAVWWGVVLMLHDMSRGGSAESGALLVDSWDACRGILRSTVPLGFVMLLLSLNTNIPRYFLEAYRGSSSLGIFAAVSSPLVGGMLVVGAIGQSTSPRLARLAQGQNWSEFRRLLGLLIACGVGLGAVGVLIALVWGEPLLRIVFLPEYAPHAPVLVWLTLAAGVGYVASLLGYGMTALHQFSIQLPLFLLVTGALLLGAWYWVPRHGLVGAALATLAGAVVQLAGSGIILAQCLSRRANSLDGR